MKQTRVLVIHDDPTMFAAYTAAFDVAGFKMRTAGNGGAGFAVLQMFRPDVVILDLCMPIRSGLTWLAAARELPGFKRLPVIVVTDASAGSSELAAVRAFGAQRVLSRKLWTRTTIVAAARRATEHPAVATLSRAA
jgi:DNA-binding response OmpR family regulator